MKIKTVLYLFIAMFLNLSLISLQSACAEESAVQDANDVYQDTKAFDGGDGSTINVSPAAEDQANGQSDKTIQ